MNIKMWFYIPNIWFALVVLNRAGKNSVISNKCVSSINIFVELIFFGISTYSSTYRYVVRCHLSHVVSVT